MAQPEKPGIADPKEAGAEFMHRHPEVRQALADYFGAGKHQQFGEFYRQLGLTPEQISQFEEILRQGGGFGRQLTFGTVTLSLGEQPKPDELRKELTAVLGEDGFRSYVAYTHTLYARMIAANLASLGVESDSPLSVTQARQVAEIFAAAPKPKSYGFDWDKALANSAFVLNPSQMQMLRTLRTRTEGWQKVLEATR
jgi:hypothetical protein